MATALNQIEEEFKSVPQALHWRAQLDPAATALRYKEFGLWKDVSWGRYRAEVDALARGLLDLGIAAGDRVALLGDNRYEWVLSDLAVQSCGGVTVGIYQTSSNEQVRYILEHSGARFLFLQDAEQLDKWLACRDSGPQVERVFVWDLEGLRDFSDPAVLSFQQELDRGSNRLEFLQPVLERRLAELTGEDLAVLVYTSGTTGEPKGVMLSHRNVLWAADVIATYDPRLRLGPQDELLSFLPLCHIFERLFSVFLHLRCGYVLNFVESPETVAQNLREVSPTLGYGVPRIWEKLASRIELKIKDASWLKRRAFALAVGGSADRRSLSRLAEWTVLNKLRKRLGLERMRAAITGAAPISPDVLEFYRRIGLPMIEGYGQTETSGIISGTRLGYDRPGLVGQPFPGVEVRIADDGEILVRSPGVFQGYYRDPGKTRETLDGDGWLHTGDVGELTPDGYLRIVDRKKDILITAGGKNVAPQYIENKLKFSPYIYDAVLVGEGRPFLSALIVLDEENVAAYAQDHRIPCATYAEMACRSEILRLVEKEIEKVNSQVSRVERVRKFRVLPKRLYEEDGEVTPTMKVRRITICGLYGDLVESMYS